GVGEGFRDRVGGHVPAGDCPLIVLLGEDGAGGGATAVWPASVEAVRWRGNRGGQGVLQVTPGVSGVRTSDACLDPAWLLATGAVCPASVRGVTWSGNRATRFGAGACDRSSACSALTISDKSPVVCTRIPLALGERGRSLTSSVANCGNHDTGQVSSVCFSWSGTLGWE